MIVNAGRCFLLALDRGSFVHQCLGKIQFADMVGAQTIVVKPRAMLRKYWAIWSQSSGSLDAAETGLLSIYVLRLHSLRELCLA